MPLTKGQIAALTAIAAQRSPDSYVAGSAPLNRDLPRASNDVDIFQDREERVGEAAEAAAATLAAQGFSIRWLRRSGAVQSLIASRDGEDVKLEWVADSDFRFFPTVEDPLFGYTLHEVDLALNKAQAAGGRREVRDLVDLVAIHETVLPLGAVIWAAVEKSPGYSPEALIGEIRRNSHYSNEEWRALSSAESIDPAVVMGKLRAALDDAETFVRRMPTDKVGRLFLTRDGRVIQPDPLRLSEYTEHTGQRLGHWPSSPDITAAMMDRLRKRGGGSS